MTDTELRAVIVTIDDQHTQVVDSVVRELEAAGLQVGNVLSGVGIVSGNVPASALEAVQRVKGVLAVEPDREMQALDDQIGD